MATKDYYDILGIPRHASEQEIRNAFRRLARQWHPDVRPGDPEAERRFKEISEAYEVLSDPEKRRQYDQFGPEWQAYAGGAAAQGPRPGAAGGADGWQRVYAGGIRFEDLRDLFGEDADLWGSLFGGRGGAGAVRPRPGRDIVQPVEITLEEALRGTTRTVVIRDGGGERRVEVRIPRGADTGTRVRAAGQGEPGLRGGPPGDLYLEVTVVPHPRFRRQGDDLYTRLEVPVWTLILGGEVEVPTLTERVQLKVPADTDDGALLRLRGQGMPRLQSPAERGDLYVEVHGQIPHGLSAGERELVQRLARRAAPGAARAAGAPWRSWVARWLGHAPRHARAW